MCVLLMFRKLIEGLVHIYYNFSMKNNGKRAAVQHFLSQKSRFFRNELPILSGRCISLDFPVSIMKEPREKGLFCRVITDSYV